MSLFEPVFEALNRYEARYLVAGGLAVVLHGHPRLTADLDLALDLDLEPGRKAVAALTELGLRPRLPVAAEDFADPSIRERWVRERNLEVFSLHDPANPLLEVDLFAVNPIPFEDLWARAEVVQLETVRVPVVSIADLIRMKELADRPVDRSDIEALRGIEAQRRDDG